MTGNRLNIAATQPETSPAGAFVAVPAMLMGVMDAATFQQRLYQWAYEQARQSAQQMRRPAGTPDLFAIMN